MRGKGSALTDAQRSLRKKKSVFPVGSRSVQSGMSMVFMILSVSDRILTIFW